jgi:hypothetical protein
LSCTFETTAASKLKTTLRAVPAAAPTVMVADLNKSPISFDRHVNIVDVVHDVDKHAPRSDTPPRSSAADAV